MHEINKVTVLFSTPAIFLMDETVHCSFKIVTSISTPLNCWNCVTNMLLFEISRWILFRGRCSNMCGIRKFHTEGRHNLHYPCCSGFDYLTVFPTFSFKIYPLPSFFLPSFHIVLSFHSLLVPWVSCSSPIYQAWLEGI